ncbi:hypothetical protein ABB07_20045 [Streptomyces incarnatus]|uniref:Uncharacterized protein n=1 Tax=Streptomyces incarnatus TaxID=665007 RepID=A0ABN4GEW6_9ACTN|nr:hypothetical protein ABB07_20045 [Streptomyces incarnatus]
MLGMFLEPCEGGSVGCGGGEGVGGDGQARDGGDFEGVVVEVEVADVGVVEVGLSLAAAVALVAALAAPRMAIALGRGQEVR